MVQTIEHDNEIIIHLKCYDGVQNKYMAWVATDGYGGLTVTANTIEDCMKELSISFKALELYRKANNK